MRGRRRTGVIPDASSYVFPLVSTIAPHVLCFMHSICALFRSANVGPPGSMPAGVPVDALPVVMLFQPQPLILGAIPTDDVA